MKKKAETVRKMVVEVDDQLIVEVAKENLDWGYNPCPNGTVVTVVGFGEVKYNAKIAKEFGVQPGVYKNRCWVTVRLPNGHQESISWCFLRPVNKDLKHSTSGFEFLRSIDDDNSQAEICT